MQDDRKLAGVNVLFDSDYKSQKISIELNDVTLREAFDMVAVQSKTFWQATSTNTILPPLTRRPNVKKSRLR